MVTVGMNYEIRSGKESTFEQVFDKVLDLMKTLPGHEETHLYRAVKNSQMYLIISQWADRATFDAFISSERFLKVTDWGKQEVLASRPKHEIYGGEAPTGPATCPVDH